MVKKKRVAKKVAARKPAKKAAPRAKKAAPRKRAGPLRRLENAIEVGVAEFDDVAVSLGLIGAVEPAPKKRQAKRKKKR